MGTSNSTGQESRDVQAENLEKLFGNAKFNDFKLIVGKGLKKTEFNVHRCILATHSVVFEAMFNNNMREKNEATANIDDTEPEVMKELLRFVYIGKVEKLNELASELWIAADKYEINGLKKLCEEKLIKNVSVDNVYEMLCLIDNFGIEELKEVTVYFILCYGQLLGADEQFRNSIKTLSADLLTEILCTSLRESLFLYRQ